jgi:hypothetical protein
MFKFGWLMIAPADLAIWQAYPNAAHTLLRIMMTTDAGNQTREEFVLALSNCGKISRLVRSEEDRFR